MSWAESAAAVATPEDVPGRTEADAAFERFFLDGYPKIVKFLGYLCPDHGLIEDATQEAFITAREKWETVATYAQCLRWVRIVARHNLLRQLRRQRRQPCCNLDDITPKVAAEPKNPREAQRHVVHILRQLPERQAAVLALSIDGYSAAEIGCELGLAINTVRAYRSSARAKFKELAAKAGFQDDTGGRRT